MGFAFIVVMVSKQEVKETTEPKVPLIMILEDDAGFPVIQDRFEVMMQRTLSPSTGL